MSILIFKTFVCMLWLLKANGDSDTINSDLKSIISKLENFENRLNDIENLINSGLGGGQKVQNAPLDCSKLIPQFDDRLEKFARDLQHNFPSKDQHSRSVSAFGKVSESCIPPPKSCYDIYKNGQHKSDRYTIYPGHDGSSLDVYCDMDTHKGGWTVIQRRTNGEMDFNKTWDEYARGFGDVTKEHWIGNKNLHKLLRYGGHTLRVDLTDFNDITSYAEYSLFKVSSENDGFRIEIGEYFGNAGDSINGRRSYLRADGMRFSTYDRDQDKSINNLASDFGGGWWYNRHTFSTLNGRYLDKDDYERDMQALIWFTWRGYHAIKSAEMKIKPSMCPCKH